MAVLCRAPCGEAEGGEGRDGGAGPCPGLPA